MLITILTLFPEIFPPILNHSILGRAQKKGLVRVRLMNIRDFAADKHKSVDDKPYGGGVGMVMRIDVVAEAIEKAKARNTPRGRQPRAESRGMTPPMVEEIKPKFKEKIILLDPKGKTFDQVKARSYSKLDHLILICGHYEGVDARIFHFVDEKISIGNYVLTGGEIPAMVITDAVVRLLPGVLTKKEATLFESFSIEGYLEEPQYTRPSVYKGYKVPVTLLSGNHQKIALWRKSKRKLLK